MERIRFEGTDWDGHWSVSGGHAGDEYGNCTLYFRCPLFGVIWWYPTGHYQTEVPTPYPAGVSDQFHRWMDAGQRW